MLSLKSSTISLALFALVMTGCKTASTDSGAESVVGDVLQADLAARCITSQSVITPVLNATAADVVVYLFKLGVPQGTDAKNVCSCIFVAGLPEDVCVEKEAKINLKPGSDSPLVVDTRYAVDIKVQHMDDPAHPGETLSTVTTKPKLACVGLGGPERIARFSSYWKKYGCTLGGPIVAEKQMP